ncbi:hypothetical protein Tfer_0224 [Thermincola ferriacetica]|uniref:Uncharacterized protein n=2 Tax=Thermincola TaxID=278993 RepID=D5XEQ8_THEPJ|nr:MULTISPECIES: hypothetical protein [Thermincola]ADG82129.1 hypothetical protein TherJR_1267 [Thermincola potens JR]KNZ71146.1 hypothetical protein Tfer_0224 [Thermincola ferriacetica]
MSDQGKLAVILVLIIGALMVFTYLTSSHNKDFAKVYTEYKQRGKQEQVSPDDIAKGFK